MYTNERIYESLYCQGLSARRNKMVCYVTLAVRTSRGFYGPEVKLACGKDIPRAQSLDVRAPCTDTPRTRPRGWDLGRNIVLIRATYPFATRLALWNGEARQLLVGLEFVLEFKVLDTFDFMDDRFEAG